MSYKVLRLLSALKIKTIILKSDASEINITLIIRKSDVACI